MSQKARVFLRRGSDAAGADIGDKEVYPRPALRGTVRFSHQGKILVGVVERIRPADWPIRPHGAPAIHVVLTEPAWSAG
jgi:hypothetical protein